MAVYMCVFESFTFDRAVWPLCDLDKTSVFPYADLSVFEVYVCLQLDLSKKDQDLREAQILAEKQAADLNAR